MHTSNCDVTNAKGCVQEESWKTGALAVEVVMMIGLEK